MAKDKITFFTVVYAIIVILDLTTLSVFPDYRFITKPMVMISLIVYYMLANIKLNWMFLGALIFALLGDIFLLNEGSNPFLYGIIAFLSMQLIYTYLFFKWRLYSTLKLGGIIALLLYGTALSIFLLPHVDTALRPAIIIYALCITGMGISAWLLDKSNRFGVVIMIGAVLFILSDTLLAIDKFVYNDDLLPICIMATYAAAQYLIVLGFMGYKKSYKH